MLLFRFVDCYSNLRNGSKLLDKLRFYSAMRFILRSLLKLCKPFLHGTNVLEQQNRKERIIVSLTSFPVRFNNLWLVLESMLGQSMQPDMIIVWLCRDEVPSLDMLPQSLKKIQNRGVEFRFCDKNLRSYNKFYYTCQRYPNDYVITIDDDIVYPKTLIENLMNLHERYPEAICCNAGMLLTLNENGDIDSLANWRIFEEEMKSNFIMAQGVGGVLYPPHSLPDYTFRDDVFTAVCPRDDDTWLHVMEFMNGTSVIKGKVYFSLLHLETKNDVKICDTLYAGDTAETIRHIREYVMKDFGIDPYRIWN